MDLLISSIIIRIHTPINLSGKFFFGFIINIVYAAFIRIIIKCSGSLAVVHRSLHANRSIMMGVYIYV